MFFFLLRRMKKIPNAIAMRTATPPIVPPTIAPTGVEDELWVGVGVEDADVDVVEKITGVGLGIRCQVWSMQKCTEKLDGMRFLVDNCWIKNWGDKFIPLAAAQSYIC